VLIRQHGDKVYIVVVSLLGVEDLNESSQGSETVFSYKPFFNKELLPIGKYVATNDSSKPSGLFFSIFLIDQEIVLDLVQNTAQRADLDDFEFLEYVNEPTYYSFVPLSLEQGTFLQGKFSLPVYDYYEGV
jgi:hypothetical protein